MWSSLPYFNIAIGGVYFYSIFRFMKEQNSSWREFPEFLAVSILPWCDVVSVVIMS